ncbi:MAG: hypothetical protein HQL23_05800 [Candidatus Omnitrophica bacterium]|nr:hypothetical protein [Candidatus Omnitrophota bacterium]
MVLIQVVCVVLILWGLMIVSVKAQDQKSGERPSVSSETIQSMSRIDIQNALKKIDSNNPPPPKMGAMCYEPGAVYKHKEYVCPLDGEKTMYATESKAFNTAISAPEIRSLVKELGSLVKGISFSLDEKKLCAKCFPNIVDADRKIALIVQYSDGRTVRTEGVTAQDIRYLIGFFQDGLSYKTNNDGQEPLKEVEPRLKVLLGEN